MTVTRRRVLYIPGYDPFHPRRYRELYRKEGAAQAAISGYTISQRKGAGPYSWVVETEMEGARTEAHVEVLVWSDIVSDSMSGTLWATYAALFRTAWTYIASGALWRLAKLRKGPVIAALYPVVFLLLQALAALAVVGLAVRIGAGFGGGGALLGLVAGAAGGYGLLRWFKAKDSKVFAHYLMHDYAFSARLRGANPPELEARMAVFGDRIAEALGADWDEVLIVGHSSGAHLAISVLADLIRADRVPEGRCALLTLGHVVPMVSFLPEAGRLRADLHLMGAQDRIAWIDVTAPGDGCAFALCDPVAVSGVAPEGQRWPLVISAAFTKTLSPERWAQLRRRWFRLHFQYLCAFDRPGDYDYFRITAGPQRLGDRFSGRKPSPSRLTAPINRYTSHAA
ncbi:hypothetical protein [Jannaschia seohaensis]|uniref:Lipase (Class 3) n=1 Tax=Jannaschia seohaensis TaxID=475081 RepID=A0A2Y9C7K0_9RHOB|nr:hypothetical protein [Jannaschia seohaensis]PWJ19201.1 hypothetical protein BCF38_104132 [Jannaschia seohaensis]SSA45863.1 hypothetical protein SAMN05421539_104132 [Jannaschia seohaensis]